MRARNFSFQNLLQDSKSQRNVISSVPKKPQQPQSQQNFKEKYLTYKQNMKKFMQMVEKQFQELTKKHNDQKQALQQQIKELKAKLKQKNQEVSMFTIRSKKIQNTNQKPYNQRSMSQDGNNSRINCFEGIQGFDQSGIHFKNKSYGDKSLSNFSMPNTLVESDNALNQRNVSRINAKSNCVPNNLTHNQIKNTTLNTSEYSNRVVGNQRRSRANKQASKVQNQQISTVLNQTNFSIKDKQMEKQRILIDMMQRKMNNTMKTEISNRKDKENQVQASNSQQDKKKKSQQASVRNILKNLRSTMQTNIERQANLQAPKVLSLKS